MEGTGPARLGMMRAAVVMVVEVVVTMVMIVVFVGAAAVAVAVAAAAAVVVVVVVVALVLVLSVVLAAPVAVAVGAVASAAALVVTVAGCGPCCYGLYVVRGSLCLHCCHLPCCSGGACGDMSETQLCVAIPIDTTLSRHNLVPVQSILQFSQRDVSSHIK